MHGEKNKDTSLPQASLRWSETRTGSGGQHQLQTKTDAARDGRGTLELLGPDKVDYRGESGHRGGECCPNKAQSGSLIVFFSVLLSVTTET